MPPLNRSRVFTSTHRSAREGWETLHPENEGSVRGHFLRPGLAPASSTQAGRARLSILIVAFVLISVAASVFLAVRGRAAGVANTVDPTAQRSQLTATSLSWLSHANWKNAHAYANGSDVLSNIFASKTVMPLSAPAPMPFATLLFWRTDGNAAQTWTGTNWSNPATATGGTAWTSGSDAEFSANSTLSFATTAVGNVTVDDGKTVTVTAGATTLTLGGVRTLNIGTGSTLTWTGQGQSTAAANEGAGIIKSGTGTLSLGSIASNARYDGGFTLGAGTVIVSGQSSFGTGLMTINGGTLQSSGGNTFTPSSVVIGGDFAFSGSGNDVWNQTVALGSSTRTITNGTTSSGATRTFSNTISGGSASTGLTFNGAGASSSSIVLSGANTYTGDTTINAGSLSLSTTGSLASANIIIGGGGTFNISTRGGVTLNSGQGLQGSGTATTGTITTAASNGLTTASDSPLKFTAFNGTTAPLTISGAGTVTVASGNPVTVTTTSALGAGDYTLIAKGATGSVAGIAPTSLTVNGSGLAANTVASLLISVNQLVLHVVAGSPPSISKTFSISPINVGGTAQLTIFVSNPNPSNALTGVGYTDTLPTGLTVPDLGPTSQCGGTVTIASNTITLAGATVPAGLTCTFATNVTATAAGTFTNNTSNVTSGNAGTGNSAAAQITVHEFTPPTISYTAFTDTTSTSNRTLSATVTDDTGVPTSGTGLPVIYFRKGSSGAYTANQCSFVSGSSYSCVVNYSLVGGAALGNTFQYYVLAQDSAPSSNVASNPSTGANGFTASPPSASTPTTAPNSYVLTCPGSLTVNDTGDGADATAGDGICATAGSVCTLRAAIQEANALSSCSGSITINFNISGSGVQTITPASVLPAITRPVIIDGTTQAGSSCTTVGGLTIELDGTNAGATLAQAGLQLDPGANGSTIKGLVINRFGSYGMFVSSSSNNVQCNYVGTNVAGTSGLGNHNSGIRISGNSNVVGGTVAGNGNIISGNSSEGIRLVGNSTQIQGNYIGINAAGTAALPNGGGGVDIEGSTNTTVGGTLAGARNIISGHAGGSFGISIQSSSSNTIVQGNYIGTDATGTSGLGNSRGVNVGTNATGNTIGGTGAGEANIIAFNSLEGVAVFAFGTTINNSVRGNSIFSNGGLGIDLNGDGVTGNDNKDPDTGPNNLENFPVLTAPLVGATTVSGTLNSTVGATFIIDVYSNDGCDGSGNGEGKTYLGSTTTSATDSNGNVSFNVTVPAVVSGKPLTATATDANGNTSEFSACASPLIPPDTDVSVSGGNLVITDSNGGTSDDTLTISLVGGKVRIHDSNHTLNAGALATQVDPNTVHILPADITGNIHVDALGGNDTLTLDFSGGNFMPSGGVNYDGGTQTSTPGDKLVITGGTQGLVTYNYTNAHDGSVVMGPYGTVNYTGLEPIVNSGTATDIVFNLPAGPNAAILGDDGINNNLSRLSGATFETTDFTNPSNSLTINRGNAADTLAVNDLPEFHVSLTIGSVGAEFSTITFNGTLSMLPNKNLSGNASSTISLSGASSDLGLGGTGTATLTTARDILLAPGSSITVNDGNLTLNANQQAIATSGDFNGVQISGTLKSQGVGNVLVNGTGGAGDFIENFGVELLAGGQIVTTSTGTITVQGTGGAGSGGSTAGQNNVGVYVTGLGSAIISATSAVQITGHGGATNDTGSYGVNVDEDGLIETDGAGTVTIDGTGGVVTGGGSIFVNSGGVFVAQGDSGAAGLVKSTGTGVHGGAIIIHGIANPGGPSSAQGVRVDRPGAVTTVDGSISITGTAAACSNSCLGTSIRGDVTATGTGAININGTGAASTPASPTHGVNVRSTGVVSAKDGNISITGTGGDGPDNAGFNLAFSSTPGPGSVKTTGTGTITINADTIKINTSPNATIDAGANAVTLLQKTAGTLIDLGSAVDNTANTLELSDGELDRITCGTLNVGNISSGAMTISAPITRSTATILKLTSGANIFFSNGSLNSSGADVTLIPVSNVYPNTSGIDVTTSATKTLKLTSGTDLKIVIDGTTADSGYTQLDVAGLVDLNGANLALSGSLTPAAGQTFIVVNNDGPDAITGTFNGLPQNSIIPNFLGSNFAAKIRYDGGDGNDVELTVLAADVSVTVSPSAVLEDGATNLVYTFTRSGVTTGNLTVNFAVSGSADATDYALTGAATYVAPNGTVTFNGTDTTASVTVDPNTDTDPEPNETVILTVAAGSGYNPFAPTSAQGEITNDDTSTAGAALDFDGADDQVNLGDITQINNAAAFTFETWVNPNALNIADRIFTKPSAGIYYVLKDTGGDSNDLLLCLNGCGATAESNSDVLTPGTWTHLAIVFDGTGATNADRLKLFVNGTAVPLNFSGTMPTSLGAGGGSAILGKNGNNSFNGKMDDVRLWSRALCPAEIQQHKDCELTGTESGLIAYYKLNQGTAGANNSGVTTAIDSGPNSYTGTLNTFALTGSTSNWVAPGGVVTGTSCPALTNLPEINVVGGVTPIPDGANSPNATDGTEFGSVDTGNTLDHNFTIQNTGAVALNISAITAGGDFIVVTPTSFPVIVAPSNSTTLTVRFQPTTTGLRTATVHIASDDCDEADYDFAIQGTGTAPTPPASLVVTKTDDTDGPTCLVGNCSLREAIKAANSDPDTNTITFDIPIATDPGCNGGSGPCTISLSTGTALAPNSDMNINGPTAYGVVVAGSGTSRVFHITAGTVSISNLTVTLGSESQGGGIANEGTLTLTNSSVSGNHAAAGGGGIYNVSGRTLTLTNSTISGNTADSGGGIANDTLGTVSLINSTVSGNTVNGSGGGIFNASTLTLTNSTVSGNTANNNTGGGIFTQGTLALTNSTVTGNTANGVGASGAGIAVAGGTVSARNTIIAANNATTAPDAVGTFNSQGHNLIGDGTLTSGFTGTGDQVGTGLAPIDPRLGPLTNNGGPTDTHALLPGSPALEAGDDCVSSGPCTPPLAATLTTDQRGVVRPQGNHVDIGAFELEAYVVNTTADHDDDTCDAADCTLREAINAANLASGPRLIAFNIPASDSRHFYYADNSGAGVSGTPSTTTAVNDSIPGIDPDYAHSWWSILVTTPLPQITNGVFIDGYTQDGATVNTKHFNEGDDAVLRIELKSNGTVNNGLDLQVGAEGTTISGLVINNFAQAGVLLCDKGDNEIAGNFIGTDVSGTLALGNTAAGIKVRTSIFDLIGGDLPAARNLISGHSSAAGVDIATPINTVEGNFIGTDRNGLALLGNKYGVRVHNGGFDNTIGCEVLDGSNLISGNSDSGVLIECADENAVVGNFIGTNNLGTDKIANGIGVQVVDSSDTLISFLDTGKGNVISGNTLQGVLIRNSSPSILAGGNYVRGNLIGTDITGQVKIKNGDAGVKIDGSNGNEIGCTVPEEGNVISGNGGEGVEITGGGSVNDVQGNFIGVALDGTTPMGNTGSGVEIYTMTGPPPGSTDNNIGFVNSVAVDVLRPRLDSRASRVAAAKQSRANKLAGSTAKGEATATKPGAVKTRASVAPRALTASRKAVAARRASIAAQTSSRTQTGKQTSRQTGKLSSINSPSGPPSLTPPPGLNPGANIIANNGGDGVKITNPLDTGNLITENSIYGNTGLGINLVGGTEDTFGVTANDFGDTDTGPNCLQNYPIITNTSANSQSVSGVLHSKASAEYVIDFYLNDSCDGSGYGEGATYIGSTPITTNSSGDQVFTATGFSVVFGTGKFITATATDTYGNTSEFSACFMTRADNQDSDISISKSAPANAVEGNNFTYTLTVSNAAAAPVAAIDVSATDVLPAGVTFASASAGCSESGGTVTCHGANIAPGAHDTFTIVVTAGPPAPVSNSATASAANDPGSPHPSNMTNTDISSCPTTFAVTTAGDDIDADQGDGHCDTDLGTPGDQCTLRAAIQEANALPGCGTININFSGVISPINLGTALPDINHDVNINGPGANLLTVQRSSVSAFRIFTISPSKTVSISGLTIANGSSSSGGGINNNYGTLTISNSTISGNIASSAGGGIYSGGIGAGNASLSITNSTISGNSSPGDGGGINVDGGSGTADLTMINSTVSGNTANNHVGGVYVISATATLTNVTITNNRADNDTSGIGAAGGLSESSGIVTLHNTIVAGNFRGGSPGTVRDDIDGTMQSGSSYNLIGDGTGMSGINNGSSGNQVGSSGSPIDPLLTPLANNGSPTMTHALLYNSPAVDQGDNAVTGGPLNLTTDQRGATFDRKADGDLVAGAVVDIGAYERQATETRTLSNTHADLADVRLTFASVPIARKDDQAGDGLTPALVLLRASLTVIDPALQPAPPPGYHVGTFYNPALPAFDVSGMGFTGPVNLCFYLPTITNPSFFGSLKILHNESGVMVDITSGQNFGAKIVCGTANTLSPFVIGSGPAPTAANGNVSGQILDSNGNPVEGAGIRMSGTQNRLTVTDAQGNYRFDNVETNGFYTVTPTRANFSFGPSQRSFSALGQHTDAAFNATPAGSALNPLETTEYFVRQQYVDFLGREPDEAGLNFWYNNIEGCGTDNNCRTSKRVDTSAAFFLSIEFQQTGYLVYRTYQTAYGDLLNAPVPVKLSEFTPDTAEISQGVVVNKNGWETLLDNNKQAFMAEFVQRPRFAAAYPSTMTPDEFVDKLFLNAGVSPSANVRATAVAEFAAAATAADAAARARALRRVAENATLERQEFNQAFVLMQYFGYLRRDANSRPDADYSGYNFWLDKLNVFNGNFADAEMVKAFLVSGEYRGRFPR